VYSSRRGTATWRVIIAVLLALLTFEETVRALQGDIGTPSATGSSTRSVRSKLPLPDPPT